MAEDAGEALTVAPVRRYPWNDGKPSARRTGGLRVGAAGLARPSSAPRRLPSDEPQRSLLSSRVPQGSAAGLAMQRAASPNVRQRPASARIPRGYNGTGYDPLSAATALRPGDAGLARPASASRELDLSSARSVLSLRRARIAGAWGDVALEADPLEEPRRTAGSPSSASLARAAGTPPRGPGASAAALTPQPKPVYYKDPILSSAMAAAEGGSPAGPRRPSSAGGGAGSRLLRTMTNVRKVLRKRTLVVFGGFGDQGGTREYWKKAWQVYETYWGRRPPKEALEADGGCSYMFADVHTLGTGREGINWYPRVSPGGPSPRVRATASHLRFSGAEAGDGWDYGSSIVVVFGGTDNRQRYADVHVFDLDAGRWVRPEVQLALGAEPGGRGPRKRDAHAAAVAWREVMLVHGGRGAGIGALEDMWALYRADDVLEWARVRQTAHERDGVLPSPRSDHTLTFVFPGALIMYGGRSPEAIRRPEFETAYRCCPDDLYVAAVRRGSGPRVPFGPSPPVTVEWRRARSAGDRPRPRYGHCAAFLTGRLWVFGGAVPAEDGREPAGSPAQCSSELFAYEPRTGEWTQYEGYDGAWPRAREGAAMWPVGRSMLFLFGGWTGRRDGPWLSELHCFDTSNPEAGWIRLFEFDERSPLPRYGHAAAIADMTNVDPAQCFAEGAGLHKCNAGVENWFRVTAVSDDGEQMEAGGDLGELKVELRGPKVAAGDWEAAVIDRGDGTYVVKYTVRRAGRHEWWVALGGKAIGPGSYRLRCYAGELDPKTSEAVGKGTSEAVAGVATTVVVEAKDTYGNPCFGEEGDEDEDEDEEGEGVAEDEEEGKAEAEATPPPPPDEDASDVQVDEDSDSEPAPEDAIDDDDEADAAYRRRRTEARRQRLARDRSARLRRRIAGRPPVTARMRAIALWTEGRARAYEPPVGAQSLHCEVHPRAGGTDVSYTPSAAGVYILDILLEGRPIGGSPFTVRVGPGEPDAARSVCRPVSSEAGTLRVLAGEPGAVNLEARDACGNLREGDADGSFFDVALEGPLDDAATSRAESLAVSPAGEGGRYAVSVGPTHAGRYRLSVACGGTPVAGAPLDVRVYPGLLDGGRSQVAIAAAPAGGPAGRAALLAIVARDAFGNLRSGGSDEMDFEVRIVCGDAPAPPHSVRDMGEGGYALEFTPVTAGDVLVHVSVAGSALEGSPVVWPCTPGPLSGANCTVDWDLGARPAAGELVWARVLARDKYGNVRKDSDDLALLQAQVVARAPFAPMSKHCGPAKAEPPKVEPRGEGAYLVLLVNQTAGDYELEIRFGRDGALVNGAPLPLRVYPGPPVGGSCTLAGGPPEGSAPAGTALAWTFVSRDVFGNLRGPGFDDSAQFAARIVGAARGAEIPVTIAPVPGEPGVYEARAAPQAAGEYALHVEVAREPVAGSPFRAKVVPGPADPNKSSLDLGGRKESDAGEKFAVKVTLCDAFGNPREAGGDAGEIELSLDGPGESVGGPLKAAGAKGATYEVPLALAAAGGYALHVAIAGRGPLHGSPVQWKVKAGPLDAAASSLALLPVEGAPPNAPRPCGADPVRGVVKLRDAHGNARPRSADAGQLAVRVHGTTPSGAAVEVRPTDVKVEAAGEGEYAVSFLATTAAKYEVHATAKGAAVGGSPAAVEFVAGPLSAARTTVEPSPTGARHAGDPNRAIVQCRDAFGNRRPTGADLPLIQAAVFGPADNAVPSELAGGELGVYAIVFTPERAGKYTVHAEVGGKPAAGSPLALTVGAAPPHGPLCRVLQAPPAEVDAGAELAAVVEVRDKYGNARAGYDDVGFVGGDLRPLGGGAAPADAAVLASATKVPDTEARYRVACAPERVDPAGFEFTARVDGSPVPGGAFPVRVRPGPLHPPSCRLVAGDAGGASWAGEPLRVAVTCCDRFGNAREADEAAALQLRLFARAPKADRVPIELARGSASELVGAWTPTLIGPHELSLEGGAVVPWTVHPGRPHAPSSAVLAPALGAFPAGERRPLRIAVKDVCGNPRPALVDVDAIDLDVKGPGEVPYEVTGSATEPGMYTAWLAPTAAGEYTAVVRVAEAPVPGEPASFRVEPAGLHPPSCGLALGDGPAESGAGELMRVPVACRDQFGNPRPAGADAAEIAANVSEGGTAHGMRIVPRTEYGKEAPGQYEAQWTPDKVGKLTVAISVGGVPLAGTPLAWNVVHARASGAKSRVVSISPEAGTPIAAGSEVHFVVEARDIFGHSRPAGTDEANLSILFTPSHGAAYVCARRNGAPVTRAAGADPSAPPPADPLPFALTGLRSLPGYETTRYELSAVVRVAGEVAAAPCFHGEAVGASEARLLVTPGPPSTARSDVSLAEAHRGAAMRAGETIVFDLTSRDAFGNLRAAGGDQEPSPADPKGERRWVALATLERGTGVREAASTTSSPSIRDVGGGRYAVEFVPPAPGHWLVYVAHGTERAANPIPVDVLSGKPSALKSQVTALDPLVCEAGSSNQLRLEVRDGVGNGVQGPEAAEFLASLAMTAVPQAAPGAPAEPPLPLAVGAQEAGGGQYTLIFRAEKAGRYLATIAQGGTALKGSGLAYTVRPSHVSAAKSGLRRASEGAAAGELGAPEDPDAPLALCGDEIAASLELRDAFGNERPAGVDPARFKAVVQCVGADGAASRIDGVKVTAASAGVGSSAPGACEVRLVPTKAGRYTLEVYHEAERLAAGHPGVGSASLAWMVLPGPIDPKTSEAVNPNEGQEDAPADGVAGLRSVVVIRARDKYGQPCVGGPASFREAPVTASYVHNEQPDTVRGPMAVKDTGGGTLELSFVPPVPGDYTLMAAVAPSGSPGGSGGTQTTKGIGARIKGTPMPWKVMEGARTVQLVPPADPVKAGDKFVAQFRLRSAPDDAIPADQVRAKLAARFDPSAAVTVPTITEKPSEWAGEVVFEISGAATVAGDCTLTVTYDGFLPGGSPFQFTIEPGRAFGPECSAERFTPPPERPVVIPLAAAEGLGAGPRCAASFVARDRQRNVARGVDVLDAVHAEVIGPARCFCELRDKHDGSFEAGFRPQLPGEYALHVAVNGDAVAGSPFCWTAVRERTGQATPALRQPLGASLVLVEAGQGPHAAAMQRALLCAALRRADLADRPPRTLLLAVACAPLEPLRAALGALLRFAGGARGVEPAVFCCTPRAAREIALGADPAGAAERGWAKAFEGHDAEGGCAHAAGAMALADGLRTFAASLTEEERAAGARAVLVLLSDGRARDEAHLEPRLQALVELLPEMPPLSFHVVAPAEADRPFLEGLQQAICGPERLGAYVALPPAAGEGALEGPLAEIAADAALAARYGDLELRLPFAVGGQPAGSRAKRARSVAFGPDGDAAALFWVEGGEEFAGLQACESWDWSLALTEAGGRAPLAATGHVARLTVDARALVQLLAIQRLEHRLREICADVAARAAAALAAGGGEAAALPEAVRAKWLKECKQMEEAVKPYGAARQPFAPELRSLMRSAIAVVRAAQGAWADPAALAGPARAARTLAALAPSAARFLAARRAARDRAAAAARG